MISVYIGKRSRYCLKFLASRTNLKINLQGNNFPPAGAKSFSFGLSLSQNSTDTFLTCSKSPISFFIPTCHQVPRVLLSSEFCLILCIVLPLNLSNGFTKDIFINWQLQSDIWIIPPGRQQSSLYFKA